MEREIKEGTRYCTSKSDSFDIRTAGTFLQPSRVEDNVSALSMDAVSNKVDLILIVATKSGDARQQAQHNSRADDHHDIVRIEKKERYAVCNQLFSASR